MALTILPRWTWRPAPRRGPVASRAPGSITELFVHWPGVKAAHVIPDTGWSRTQERRIMRDIQAGHFANGWSDIGYNHVLFPNPGGVPRIYTARGARYVPAAQFRHNPGTIAIMVYMGAEDMLHETTKTRLRSFVRWADDYSGNRLDVRGHGEVFGTECPGPPLRHWVSSERHR